MIAQPSMALPLGTSARQLPKGSLKILAYYHGVAEEDVDFAVANDGGCSTSNGVAFPCSGGGQVETEGEGRSGLVKVLWQPYENMQYYGVFGAGDYTLRVPSTTVVNVLTGDAPGYTVGVGAKALVHADTIVSPAVAIDASAWRSRYGFSRRAPEVAGTSAANVDQRLDLWRFQLAVVASHVFEIQREFKFEPYGGVKWIRTEADLKDLQTGAHAGGKTDATTPFVGVRVPVWENEGLFVEASQLVGGIAYAAGLEIRFGSGESTK